MFTIDSTQEVFMITTIFFDLDGTLLPMDQDVFVKSYFGSLAAKMAPLGYEPEKLVKAIWIGTGAMVNNPGGRTNEAVFWEAFTGIFGQDVLKEMPYFDSFYRNEFQNARHSCGFNPQAAQAIREIKAMGFRTVLATNPIFPAVATQSRIRWAGLTPEDFELITTYENSCHCKPNPDYYRDILEELKRNPEECVMVGNDVSEDMVAETLGMKVFLLTDCLINKENKDIQAYAHGSFPELMAFVRGLN